VARPPEDVILILWHSELQFPTLDGSKTYVPAQVPVTLVAGGAADTLDDPLDAHAAAPSATPANSSSHTPSLRVVSAPTQILG
jgi:hypothetical protein